MSGPLSRRLHAALGSLKLRLALAAMGVIATSVALTALLVLNDVGQRSQRAILDAELGHVEKLAGVLSSRLVSLQLALRSASAELVDSDLRDLAAMQRFLAGERVLATLFSSVFVAAPDGTIVALGDADGIRDPRVSIGDRPYFKRTLAEQRPIVSEPVISRVSAEGTIVLTMPVRGKDGATVAVLGGGMRLSKRTLMSDLTQAGSSDHDPVVTIITDSLGRIISHADAQWLLREAHTEPHIADAIAQWVAEGRPVEPQGSARRAADHVVAMAGVPDADWVVFRSARAEALLGGVQAGLRDALWLSVGAAATGGCLIFLATLLMLRPLRRLEQRALHLLHDDMAPEEGWPQARGEIGELSRVFQHVMKERATNHKSRDELLAKMRAVMGNAPAGITFTRQRRLELVSAQFCRMFGYPEERLVGELTRLLYPTEEAYQSLGERVNVAFAAGHGFDEELEFVRADGSRFWGHAQGVPVRAGDPSGGAIWIITDHTATRSQREQLSWSAAHDPLTELINRREFEARLAAQLSERRASEICSALFIDLDRFKLVNDSAGHAAGDAMLKTVAAILVKRVRADDSVARIGGDEFAVLLRGCDQQTAERVAEQVRTKIDAHRMHWQGQTLSVGASIGVVQIDDTFADAAAVMSAADAACYEAKRAGRNAVRSHAAYLRLVDRA